MTNNRNRTGVLIVLLVLALSAPGFGQQWQRTYGGSRNDFGYAVVQTRDSGFIVTGYTTSRGAGHKDVYLLKTSALGDTQWSRVYGGANDDIGWSVAQTYDGGYIIAGETYSFGAGQNDVYLIKTNAAGDTQWTRTYGSSLFDAGYSVRQTLDSGFVVAGYTYGSNMFDMYLVKTNSSGDTLWTATLGDVNDDKAYCIRQTSDRGYIVTGYHSPDQNHSDIYLVRVDAGGHQVWAKSYLATAHSAGYAVMQTPGGYIVAGFSGAATQEDVQLVKTDTGGENPQYASFGGAGTELAYDARLLPDGGCIIAGMTNSFGSGGADLWLVRTDSLEDSLWTRTYGGLRDDQGTSVSPCFDGGFIVAGWTRSFGVESTDVFMVKTDNLGRVDIEEEPLVRAAPTPALSVMPNPFVAYASVRGHEQERVALYDVSCRKVGEYRGDRIGEGLPAGVYFLRLAKHPEDIQRLVKLR
jgi:hypothetical protein